MKIENELISRKYIFNESEMRKLLNIRGNINNISFANGELIIESTEDRSPKPSKIGEIFNNLGNIKIR